MEENIRAGLFGKTSLIAKAVFAFLGTYGFCCLGTVAGVANASYTVLGVAAFLVIWVFADRTEKALASIPDKKARRRRIVFAELVSFLLALSMLMGYQLQNNGLTDGGFRGKGLLLLRTICLSAAFFPLGNLFFQRVEHISPEICTTVKKQRPAAVFAISAGIVFACLIPVWLAYYPIVMSYDFHRQVNEAYNGFAYFSPYQTLAHTWVIWVFLQLGKAVGSLETGFACMALFQMILYALVTGYACSMLYRILNKKWVVAAAVLFFGVFPFNTVMVVCTTKDVLFTILFLLFFLLLLEHSLFCRDKAPADKPRRGKAFWHNKKNMIDLVLVLEGCLMIQLRNNAFYAVAVFMVLFVLLVPRREKLRTLLLCVLLIAGGKGTGLALREAIGTELSGVKVEMFNVPIQQFGRVGYYHGSELDEFTALELDHYVPWQEWEYYNPPLSDTIKFSVRRESFEEDYGRLFSLWVKLGLKYPNEYLDAFLELTRGYWFLDDVSWAENLGSGVEGRMGAVFTYNSSEIAGVGSIVHESRFPWLEAQLEKIVSGNAFYDWPVISLVFRSAFYTWSLFLITIAYIYKKQKKQLKLSLFLWLYFGTVLLGPVVQLRYVFPIMAVLPILAAMLYLKEETENV